MVVVVVVVEGRRPRSDRSTYCQRTSSSRSHSRRHPSPLTDDLSALCPLAAASGNRSLGRPVLVTGWARPLLRLVCRDGWVRMRLLVGCDDVASTIADPVTDEGNGPPFL